MRNLRLLLAEDDHVDQQLLLAALMADRPFVDVCTVSTGREFRELLARRSFDCAVVNYHLPDADAVDLLRHVGGQAGRCPVLVVSDDIDPQQVIASFRNGSVDFVPKGEAFQEDGLWKRVELAVRQRRRSERRRRQLSLLAETDPLTGLYNRRFLMQQLQSHAFRSDRRRTISCILLDVDYFKRINDTYGHGAGDRVLKRLAREIRANLRGGDTAMRWGGEEFLILRPSTDLSEAWIWSDDLRRRLADLSFQVDGEPFGVTASMGVVSLPTASMGPESVDMADDALYLAKRQGRDRVCTWPMTLVERALAKAEAAGAGSPVDGRRLFLDGCRDVLGPTQTRHVTIHCSRVAETAGVLGCEAGLGADQVHRMRMAGLIHDLGKCVIPESMLTQREPLTVKQWGLIHRRADFAVEMGKRLGFDEQTLDYVRRQRPASGAPVLLPARLVGVADAVVAMRSDRTYRPARTTEDVLAELRRCTGVRVDPAMVTDASEGRSVPAA